MLATGRAEPIVLEYFTRCLDLAERHGIQVLYYECPWPPAHDTQEDHDRIAHYREILRKAAGASTVFTPISYDYTWEHTLFSDPLHLNNQGADRLSRLAARRWMAVEDGEGQARAISDKG